MTRPNDEKLTAYVLDELTADEKREIEEAIEADSETAKLVTELTATVKFATEALDADPGEGLTENQKKTIDQKASRPRPRRRFMAVGITAAAAALVVVVLGSLGIVSVLENKKDAQQAGSIDEEDLRQQILAELMVQGMSSEEAADSLAHGKGKRHKGEEGLMASAPPSLMRKGKARKKADTFTPLDGRLADIQDNEGVVHETEKYDHIVDNPFQAVHQNPLSTFSIDVDTASYSNMRRFLNEGSLPPKDAVRIEEMVNYFSYDYAPPVDEHPFGAHVEVSVAPWNGTHRLARIGLKGREMPASERPSSNLVFLLDVSGSMDSYNKLPLLKKALRMLVENLDEKDRIALVVYAGASGLALPSTSCDDRQKILDAMDQLNAGGSTNGGEGIELAYSVAEKNFIKGGINRVILATDGDFNVGTTSQGDLTRLIEDKAESGVFLTVLGFGMGNYADSTLETLADKGNGNYGYIDTVAEARKMLVEQMGGTLVTIAKDVKIQVEFNPAEVAAYRLIGYENRMLAAEDFNDDTKDAGEIGAGHTVTALYEIVPAGVAIDIPSVDSLKYQKPVAATDAVSSGEMFTLKLRYKKPDGDKSTLMSQPVTDIGQSWAEASVDFKFAAAVAAFGMMLRDSPHKGDGSWSLITDLASQGKGADPHGYRAEFLSLVAKASKLSD